MTLKERETVIENMIKNVFCTHYAGYICNREYPCACKKCINSWIIRNGIKNKAILEKYI
jgi:hypothetical protein